MVAETVSTVAKVVFGGTMGSGSAPQEIWSTSFHVASLGTDSTMADFNAAAYLANNALPFAQTVIGLAADNWNLTFVKVNRYRVSTVSGATGPHQVEDPTVEELGLTNHGSGNVYVPFYVSSGWGLQSTFGTRGRAAKGRMFLPPLTGAAGGGGAAVFGVNGQWAPGLVSNVSNALSPAWDTLNAGADAGGAAGNYRTVLVSPPRPLSAGGLWLVNPADITIAEATPWIVGRRKNALPAGGVSTTHPAF